MATRANAIRSVTSLSSIDRGMHREETRGGGFSRVQIFRHLTGSSNSVVGPSLGSVEYMFANEGWLDSVNSFVHPQRADFVKYFLP